MPDERRASPRIQPRRLRSDPEAYARAETRSGGFCNPHDAKKCIPSGARANKETPIYTPPTRYRKQRTATK